MQEEEEEARRRAWGAEETAGGKGDGVSREHPICTTLRESNLDAELTELRAEVLSMWEKNSKTVWTMLYSGRSSLVPPRPFTVNCTSDKN